MSTRNKYICREIPQPDFVASFDGDMVVGQLKDATFIPGEDGQDGQDGTPGTDGQEVTLQTTATHIQWRLGTGEWQNLVALTELMGTDGQPGTDGEEVTLQTTATHIQWRLGTGEWQNLIALSELMCQPMGTGHRWARRLPYKNHRITHIQWRLRWRVGQNLMPLAS